MSILTKPTEERTKEKYLKEIANRIVDNNARLFHEMRMVIDRNFNAIWNPNQGDMMMGIPEFEVTDQEVLDALESIGVSTLELFGVSKALQDILEKVSGGEYKRLVPPKEFTYDNTGKIVVAKPVEEEIIS